MGVSIWTWKTRYGAFSDGFQVRVDRDVAANGVERVRTLGPSRFVLPAATVIFTDGTAGESLKDFDTFFRTTLTDGTDSYLFKSHTPAFFKVEGEAGGTATGGAPGNGETFTTAKKFLDLSPTTLVVKSGGVLQVLTTDYTVSGNNTAPTITATANMDAGAITFDYEFYYQVRATVAAYATSFLTRGSSLTDPGAQTINVSMREVTPGGHLA